MCKGNWKEKGEQAAGLFRQGYNCAQSVAGAFAADLGYDADTILRLATSFGGGMGRMRQVCGAVSGMALVMGMALGNTDPKDQQAKTDNYAAIRRLAGQFEQQFGSIVCGTLLGLTRGEARSQGAAPEQRTEEYYKKRPCVELVRYAAEITAQFLEEHTAAEAL